MGPVLTDKNPVCKEAKLKDVLDFEYAKNSSSLVSKPLWNLRSQINWDHAGINYVPVSTWMIEKKTCYGKNPAMSSIL